MGDLFAHDVINSWDTDMKRVRMTDSEMTVSSLADNDLLFGRRSLVESGAGKCSLVGELTEPTTFESSIIRVRVNQSLIRSRFVFYWLKSHSGRGRMQAIVTGTNVKGIRASILKTLQIPCPPVRVQDTIVSILRTYDDLIENNRRRIQLLEQTVRMLYDEWFVRLRFPGHEGMTVTNGVPEGWETKPLSALCDDVRESVDPKTLQPDTTYIGLEHMPRRSITLNEWASSVGVESAKLAFREGDVLFGRIRPYFHKVGFTLTDGIASSDAIVIRPTNRYYEYVLLLLSSDGFVSLASKTVREGSKMPRADWKFLSESDVLIPEPPVLNAFRRIIRPVLDQLRNLALDSRQLAAARDLLLPRLMNGETSVDPGAVR